MQNAFLPPAEVKDEVMDMGDSKHLVDLIEQGAPIVSNQVSSDVVGCGFGKGIPTALLFFQVLFDIEVLWWQVSFSVLDTRPLQQMVPACQQHGVQLLCYGTLLVVP